MESVGFSMYNIMSSAKSESLTSSLPILMPLISFCCLIADASTSNPMLNNSSESGHPGRVPDLREKALSFSPLRMMLAVGFFVNGFMMFKYVPSIPTFLRVFIKKRVFFSEFFQMLFLHRLTGSYSSFLFFC